jgi:hypothetical protein
MKIRDDKMKSIGIYCVWQYFFLSLAPLSTTILLPR